MTAAGIAHLRIKLDDVEPVVMRRLEVPLATRLDRLHLVLQAAMGWTNSHLYEFRARVIGCGIPDPDFGDGWEHSVRIERITEPVAGTAYPRLIEAAGQCPPEDVGGPPGYAEFLDALADPDHQQHAENLQWVGGHFDSTTVDLERLNRHLNTLAKRCSCPPTASRKPSN